MISTMEQMPNLRTKVFNQVGEIADRWQNQKGMEGMRAGQVTRKNLAEHRKM